MNNSYAFSSEYSADSYQANANSERTSTQPVEDIPDTRMHHSQPPYLQLPKPPSFSASTGPRAKSAERRKSAGLPAQLNLKPSGYGLPVADAQNFEKTELVGARDFISLKEMFSAMIIVFPYALASIVFGLGVVPQTRRQDDAFPNPAPPSDDAVVQNAGFMSPSVSTSLSGVLAVTLGALGVGGKIAQIMGKIERTRTFSLLDVGSTADLLRIGQQLATRILVVGLPFYATSCLGGSRVATALLFAKASSLMVTEEDTSRLSKWKDWRRIVSQRKWSVAVLLLQVCADAIGFSNSTPIVSIGLGYIALGVAIFVMPPPYPSSRPIPLRRKVHMLSSKSKELESSSTTSAGHTPMRPISSIVCSPEDIDLTLTAAMLMAISTYVLSLITTPGAGALDGVKFAWSIFSGVTAALALMFADSYVLRSHRGVGSTIGSLTTCLLITMMHHDSWIFLFYQSVFVGASHVSLVLDTRLPVSQTTHTTRQDHHHNHKIHHGEVVGASKMTNYIVPKVQNWPLLHTILLEKDSRRIFYFMCLNFAFMLVQTFYGIVSGSLGLLSDSIHMFFDCLALLVGLSAAVMSKWPPSRRFPYGYAKIETLAGFANGVFLMLISVEIIYEAIERLSEGSNVKRLGELMTVSILGFLINIVGILAFGHAHHGHDHSHGHSHDHDDHGHSHSHGHDDHPHKHHDHAHEDQQHKHHHHDHDCHDHEHHDHDESKHNTNLPALNGYANASNLAIPSPTPSMYSSVPATPSKPDHHDNHAHHHGHGHHEHNHAHSHAHSHGHHHHHSENMMGIYLHVLGDTLGSLAVVVSTWLVQWNGWSGWDPLASTGIAIIIFGTAIPLVKNCASKLLLTVPEDTEYDLREALAGVGALRGVVGCTVPKFWIQEGEDMRVMGVVHVIADRVSNLEDVKERSIAFLKGAGLDVLVQVEREGARCWCQGASLK